MEGGAGVAAAVGQGGGRAVSWVAKGGEVKAADRMAGGTMQGKLFSGGSGCADLHGRLRRGIAHLEEVEARAQNDLQIGIRRIAGVVIHGKDASIAARKLIVLEDHSAALRYDDGRGAEVHHGQVHNVHHGANRKADVEGVARDCGSRQPACLLAALQLLFILSNRELAACLDTQYGGLQLGGGIAGGSGMDIVEEVGAGRSARRCGGPDRHAPPPSE